MKIVISLILIELFVLTILVSSKKDVYLHPHFRCDSALISINTQNK